MHVGADAKPGKGLEIVQVVKHGEHDDPGVRGESAYLGETFFAAFRSLSISVMSTSGLLRSMRAKASSPLVEDCPTTSTSPREVRILAKPSLNMVWSSAKWTRTAISGSPPHMNKVHARGCPRRSST